MRFKPQSSLHISTSGSDKSRVHQMKRRHRAIQDYLQLAGQSDEVESAQAVGMRSSPQAEDQPVPKKARLAVVALDDNSQWFLDGQLIVKSIDNKKFNVHAGVLSHHSPVLEQMIKEAQASSGRSEGVRLSLILPETGVDLGLLVHTLYDGGKR